MESQVRIAAMAGVTKSIKEQGDFAGFPAVGYSHLYIPSLLIIRLFCNDDGLVAAAASSKLEIGWQIGIVCLPIDLFLPVSFRNQQQSGGVALLWPSGTISSRVAANKEFYYHHQYYHQRY